MRPGPSAGLTARLMRIASGRAGSGASGAPVRSGTE